MSTASLLLDNPLAALPPTGRVWVGFSGGLDSAVLLDLAVAAGLAAAGRLAVIHVHHGLQPAADRWAEQVQAWCADYRVPCRVVRVRVVPGASVEQAARQARYRAFAEVLSGGDLLLLGHHADDQAETLLLRLMRGAGVRGLAAMPAARALGAGELRRPLLPLPRCELERYARARGLRWVDDPSNDETRFDRNFVRHRVVPLLAQRWPAVGELLNRAAGWQAEAEGLLVEMAAEDVSRLQRDGGLALEGLCQLSSPRQRNLLRYWLGERAAQVPPAKRLNQFLADLMTAGADRQPQLAWDGWLLCRYQGGLYLRAKVAPWQGIALPVVWDPRRPLRLSHGELRAEPVVGGGVRLPRGGYFAVTARQGGEQLRLVGRDGHHAVKKLFQESEVPPWERAELPFIYRDGELVAVADRWLSADFSAAEGEPGWRFEWSPGGAD